MKREETHIDLEKLSNKNPFSVPEGYFELFPSIMMERIEAEETPQKRSVIWLRYLRPAVGLAASFALIFLLMYIPTRLIAPKTAFNNDRGHQVELDDMSWINDFSLYELLSGNQEKEPMSDATIETVLTASLTDYELFGYQHR